MIVHRRGIVSVKYAQAVRDGRVCKGASAGGKEELGRCIERSHGEPVYTFSEQQNESLVTAAGLDLGLFDRPGEHGAGRTGRDRQRDGWPEPAGVFDVLPEVGASDGEHDQLPSINRAMRDSQSVKDGVPGCNFVQVGWGRCIDLWMWVGIWIEALAVRKQPWYLFPWTFRKLTTRGLSGSSLQHLVSEGILTGNFEC